VLGTFKEFAMMDVNVGAAERFLRVGAGASLMLATALGWIGLWGFLGVVPLLTGLAGYCPLYTVIHRSH
jgi:Protein of unknown function (DUF2892)